jgi:hypothetical protein
MFSFLAKTLIEILPKIKDFNGTFNKKNKKNVFSYELHETFSFHELEENIITYFLIYKA